MVPPVAGEHPSGRRYDGHAHFAIDPLAGIPTIMVMIVADIVVAVVVGLEQ